MSIRGVNSSPLPWFLRSRSKSPGPQQQAAPTQALGPGPGPGQGSNSTQKIQDAINAAAKAAETIQTGFVDIYENTSNNDVKDGVVLFLQVLESTATLIPIFGPVVVLGAQIIELQYIRNEVKETLLNFIEEIDSYAEKINQIFQILTTYFVGKIAKLNFFKPIIGPNGKTSSPDYEKLDKSVKAIEALNTKITTTIDNSKEYLNKLIKNSTNMKLRSWFTSTTTISSRVNTFRISIINTIILFLFEIDLVFFTALDGIMEEMKTNLDSVNANISSINADIGSTNATIGSVALSKVVIEQLTEQLNNLVKQVEKDEQKIQQLETLALNDAEEIVDAKISQGEPKILRDDDDPNHMNDDWGQDPSEVHLNGGYKFKSKKIKRKTKNNRKTKNKKSKNNRKTKKYI
jgi:hypothetical protein